MRHPRPVGSRATRGSRPAGSTFVEVLAALSVSATLMAMAGPGVLSGRDAIRAAQAARHVASVIRLHRTLAISSGAQVALRFEAPGPAGSWVAYADGDRDGVRGNDVASGVDRPLGPRSEIAAEFPGVTFGIVPGTRDIDDGQLLSGPAVRLGAGNWLSFSPSGSATSGTIYVRGRSGTQYAVRVLGVTGRTRVLAYDGGSGRWTEP
jgi:type II secretory pathway pseudopilin PulG